MKTVEQKKIHCHTLALKFKNPSSFKKAYPTAYKTACQLKFRDEICSHMTRVLRKAYTLEDAKKLTKKYTNRKEFSIKNSGLYSACINNGWMEEVCAHMKVLKRPPYNYEEAKSLVKKYSNLKELRENDAGLYFCIHANKWLDLIQGMELIRNTPLTLEEAIIEAIKYTTKKEFSEYNNKMYIACHNRGWIDIVCKHMTVLKRNAYSFQEVKKIAKKHSNRRDFQKFDSGAYSACVDNNWLNLVCGHMVSTINRREKRLHITIHNMLLEKYKKLEIYTEYKIPKRDNKNGRVDFYIKNPKNNKFICIEIKHSESNWTKNELRTQISKYKRSFRERNGFKGVFLVSNEGNYGLHMNEIDSIINKIL